MIKTIKQFFAKKEWKTISKEIKGKANFYRIFPSKEKTPFSCIIQEDQFGNHRVLTKIGTSVYDDVIDLRTAFKIANTERLWR
jgi:hypothetical protein